MGLGVVRGVKTSSRIDSLGIEKTVINTRAGDDEVHADPGYKFPGTESEYGIAPGDFERFDWIEVEMTKASEDPRPESYRVKEDTITIVKRGKQTKPEERAALLNAAADLLRDRMEELIPLVQAIPAIRSTSSGVYACRKRA